ncbi:hypothetical protein E8D34_07340 [Nocardioides sp. GY 10113]|uniref:DUF6325 family protein n=1 Tax=Nocardioides sp. GY 10113 TaxID=2569761 RepID=UPI0010A8383B|nr:DUF6325 family protein [Nocardioides sp. GY 10113]TIC88091.1 hypothetical protein E8D34_07340 [Nocardioides sp. GY 10113]
MDAINTGPVDVVFLRFPGNRFNGRILPALRDLVAADLIRVLDLLVVAKNAEGDLAVAELGQVAQELDVDVADLLDEIPGGWLDRDDAEEVAPHLDPETTLALLAIENLWAIPFVDAVRDAGGELVDQARVGAELVAEIRAAAEEV